MTQYQIVWQCSKCATTLTVTATNSSGGKPSTSGCPKGGSHSWNNLTSAKVG